MTFDDETADRLRGWTWGKADDGQAGLWRKHGRPIVPRAEFVECLVDSLTAKTQTPPHYTPPER